MKNFLKTSPQQVLGVMIDGRDLKLAHLGRQGSEITIFALESITLQRRLGRISTHRTPAPVAQETEGKDLFGLEETDTPPEGFTASDSEEGDVASALINVFSKYPLQKAGLAINIPEGHTTYYNFENDFGLKKETKLLKRLREELGPLAGVSLEAAIIDYFRLEGGELTAIVSEGSIPLVEELQDIKSFLPRNTPFYSLIGANEIALVNLARLNFDLPSSKITAIIFIGCEFSRVIILRGADPISFVQSVREGYQTPQICQTLFSKILLEQEEAGLPEIDHIILAGEIGVTHAFEFFTKQFPEAKVNSITPGPLNTQYLKAEEIAIFPNYAIPVALAWEALEPKNPCLIRTSLIPASIREAQKFFKIAWHGFVLLGLVFSGMVLLTYQGISLWNTINSLENSVRHKQEYSETLQPQIALVNQLQGEIGAYRANLGFMDSLIVDPGKWSRLFDKLSADFATVRKIWIEDVKSDPQGFTMIGKALHRDRIPDIAAGFDSSDLKRVTRVVSEGGEIAYEFELIAKLPTPSAADFIEPVAEATLPPAIETESSGIGSINATEGVEVETEKPAVEASPNPPAPEEQMVPTYKTATPGAEGIPLSLPSTPEPLQNDAAPEALSAEATPTYAEEQIVGVTMYSEPAGPPVLSTTEPVEKTANVSTESPGAMTQPTSEPAAYLENLQIDQPATEPPTSDEASTAYEPAIVATTMYSEPAGPPPPSSPPDIQSAELRASATPLQTPQNPVPESASATDLYDIGIRLVREREGARAGTIFKSLITTFPAAKEIAAAHYWLGECYFQAQQYTSALRQFQTSLQYPAANKRAAALLMLGQTYMKLGHSAEARIPFETLIKEFPTSEFAGRARGYLPALTP